MRLKTNKMEALELVAKLKAYVLANEINDIYLAQLKHEINKLCQN